MQDFGLYFALGREHILEWRGYDHMLFVAALCGVYFFTDWRKVLVLVTAFTIGHSLTLVLSVLNWLILPSAWVEFLIPLTIVLTALSNLNTKAAQKQHMRWIYPMALFFGLIHGLGFSNYLKSLLGTDNSIVTQLLAFNLGLEFGQILIVVAILALAHLLVKQFKVPQREWVIFLSAATFGIAFIMAIERFLALQNV
ncbi:MAG: HupE/UreJ family protein [Sphingobacteriaceae bacterium]